MAIELVVFTHPDAFSLDKEPGKIQAGHEKGHSTVQEEVLFAVDHQKNGKINGYLKDRVAFLLKIEEQDLEEQLLANDSLGG